MSTPTTTPSDPVTAAQGRPSTGPASRPRTKKLGRWMTAGQVARYFGIAESQFYAHREDWPGFPKPIAPLWPGGRKVYDRQLVEKWATRVARQAQQGEARS